jgi:hypothetical protein
MPFIGNQPADKFLTLEKQVFTTSATDTYVLDREVSSVNDIELFLNNVRQEPTEAYTISGTTLTLASAITASDSMYCIYQGRAVGTQSPAVGSVTNDMLAGSIATSKLANQNIGFRNLIINGDMSIAQRGTSVSGLTNGSSQYLIDRFRWAEAGAPSAVFTMSQDTDVPTGQGFVKSLKLDCTTAQGSLAAGDRFGLDTKLEGQNLQFLKFGTANAESLTLSFWVKSNKTGTYNIWIYKPDGTARSFASNYTISSASTWEKKTINIPADTAASGAIDNDNGEGFRITWMLAAGSNFNSGTTPTSWENYTAANIGVNNVNFADDVANDFWLTGVQLEVGTSASDFEFLPYDVNLRRCQRYFQETQIGLYFDVTSGRNYGVNSNFHTQMRATPSVISSTTIDNNNRFNNGSINASPFLSTHGILAHKGAILTSDAGYYQTLVTVDAEL